MLVRSIFKFLLTLLFSFGFASSAQAIVKKDGTNHPKQSNAIEETKDDSTVLPEGAQIIAGEKNEFFVVNKEDIPKIRALLDESHKKENEKTAVQVTNHLTPKSSNQEAINSEGTNTDVNSPKKTQVTPTHPVVKKVSEKKIHVKKNLALNFPSHLKTTKQDIKNLKLALQSHLMKVTSKKITIKSTKQTALLKHEKIKLYGFAQTHKKTHHV